MLDNTEVPLEPVLFDGKQGTSYFNTITQLYRAFLPNLYEGDVNCFDCCFSVKAYQHYEQRKGKKKNKEETPTLYNYFWTGFANIRATNTTVHLHGGDSDPYLHHMEAKLRLLKEKIDLFLRLVQESRVKPPEEDFIERVWLNPEDINPDYTGYVYLTVKKSGYHRFYLADCHRSINLFVDYYDYGKENAVQNDTVALGFLTSLSKELDKAFELIATLREQFRKVQEEPDPKLKPEPEKLPRFFLS